MRVASWLRRPVVWIPVSLGLIVVLVWRGHPWDATRGVAISEPAALAGAVLLSVVIACLWAVRSADLLGGAGQRISVLALIPMTAFANTINNVTPGSTGEVVRMYLLRAHHDVDYATSGAVIVVERLGAIGYLTATAVLAWTTWLGLIPGWVALAVGAALAIGPGLVYRLGLRPLSLIRVLPLARLAGRDRWTRARAWLARVDETIATLISRPRRLLAFVAITAAILAAYTAQLVLVGRAIGVDLNPIAAWGALGLAMTVGVLTLLPFGLGTTDLTLAGLLGAIGAPPAAAVAITLGYRLASTLPLGIAGVISYAWLSARLPSGGSVSNADGAGAQKRDGAADPAFER
jgi:glycosyltransferase 2 family protein